MRAKTSPKSTKGSYAPTRRAAGPPVEVFNPRQWHTSAQIAALIRADLKQAITDGRLPGRYKYSVTSDTYSGGQSVTIDVRAPDGAGTRPLDDDEVLMPATPEDQAVYGVRWQMRPELRQLGATLRDICAPYRYIDSDPDTDYYDTNCHISIQAGPRTVAVV